MPLASGNTTTSNVSAAVNAWLDLTLLQRAYPYFLHTRWAQVRPLPTQVGQTIKFRRYTNLDAQTTALTEAVTPAGQQLAITDITGAPLQSLTIAEVKSSLISLFSISRLLTAL